MSANTSAAATTGTIDRDPKTVDYLFAIAAAINEGKPAQARDVLKTAVERNIAAALADVEQAEGTPDDDRSRKTKFLGRVIWSWKPKKVRAVLDAVGGAAELAQRITGRRGVA